LIFKHLPNMKKIYFTYIAFLFLTVAKAQIVNIPDANFKAKLLTSGVFSIVASTQVPFIDSFGNLIVDTYNKIDTNNDGEIQVGEASAIKYLNVNNASISSLDGINSFINLQYLECNQNLLTSLNVSSLINLKRLVCTNNSLTTINTSGLINLNFLNCDSNQFTALNVSGLPSLQTLRCRINQLTSINVSGLSNLQVLFCDTNQLTSLNINGLTSLIEVYCYNNQLPSLNLSGLTSLQVLNCAANQLPILDLGGLNSLISLDCSNNQLPILNFTGLSTLEYLRCGSNQLPSLNVINLINLKNLECFNNLLPTLNVSGLTNLFALDCSDNPLPSLTLEGLPNLKYLSCSSNQLTTLNVTSLPSLIYLRCYSNQLTSLYIKNNNPVSWTNLEYTFNPNLQLVCADEEDILLVQQKNFAYGYVNCVVNSSCNLSVEENLIDTNFTLYPNPVNDILNLSTKQQTKIYSLTIYNLLGQQVQTTTSPNKSIDVSILKTGSYFVKVITGKGVSSSKFVKE
jgi:Leucine-rich repeat (LRR) protein